MVKSRQCQWRKNNHFKTWKRQKIAYQSKNIYGKQKETIIVTGNLFLGVERKRTDKSNTLKQDAHITKTDWTNNTDPHKHLILHLDCLQSTKSSCYTQSYSPHISGPSWHLLMRSVAILKNRVDFYQTHAADIVHACLLSGKWFINLFWSFSRKCQILPFCGLKITSITNGGNQ